MRVVSRLSAQMVSVRKSQNGLWLASKDSFFASNLIYLKVLQSSDVPDTILYDSERLYASS